MSDPQCITPKTAPAKGAIREIHLSNGLIAIVDEEDYEKVQGFNWRWHVNRSGRRHHTGRVTASYPHRGRTVNLSMHRLILDAKPGTMIDHKDRDQLNNRKENLRFCNRSQNQHNRATDFDRDLTQPHTRFKGVSKVTAKKCQRPYYVRLMVDRVTHYLGCYATPEEAARAYDEGAKRLHGEFARLNFPDG